MAKYYMAKSGFQPYTYEQLYTTARDLTAAHNEQETKLGALDSAAAGVEAYLDPEKHPEDQQMYDTLQNYRKGLNDITYHLASRGLSGHVFNNVMSLAADYSGKVKPIEGAVENYKKAHDARVNLMIQNPDYIPRYSWDKVSISDNLDGVSQKAVEGFKGTQYMNDITTTLQKLFNDFDLKKRDDIRVFGKQMYDLISNGMSVNTALAWLSDKAGLSDDDVKKLSTGIAAVNQRYGINDLVSTNSDENVLNSLGGYYKQGVINAIGNHKLETYDNLWDKAAVELSTARRAAAINKKGNDTNKTSQYPGGAIYQPADIKYEERLDETKNELTGWPVIYDFSNNKSPNKIGSTFSKTMKKHLTEYAKEHGAKENSKYYNLLSASPNDLVSKGVFKRKYRDDEKKAYEYAYLKTLEEKSFLNHTDPIKKTLTSTQTINAFIANNKNNLLKIESDGTIGDPLGKAGNFSSEGMEALGVSFIPSTYNLYNNISNKEDYVFITLSQNGTLNDYVINKNYIVGKVGKNSASANLEKDLEMFKIFTNPEFKDILGNYDYYRNTYFPDDRLHEEDILNTYVNAIETSSITESEEIKNR